MGARPGAVPFDAGQEALGPAERRGRGRAHFFDELVDVAVGLAQELPAPHLGAHGLLQQRTY